MNWLMSFALRLLDSSIQRAFGKGNRTTTISGFAGSGAILAMLEYLETQMGCNLGQFKLAAVVPLLQGALTTGNGQVVPKVIARTVGDDAHDQAGQG